MTHVTIKRRTSKQVDTKYGKKDKLNLLVLTEKGKEIWIDGFASAATNEWLEGAKIEVEIVSRDYQGKIYYGFKTPRQEDLIMKELKEIKQLILQLGGNKPEDEPPPHEDHEAPELEEAPF